ncbi:piggyBac transposable element-derived protein 4-like [Stegodyphus dumicola]|uniref:piggyBac transposable element-derived protein 4-like n=1 Tax=Stegodyphus dumicola TaxID=202533 RepID=UPI0015A798C2|nr:piggyBac transposable element-derived protein 4-like [Stegodyphus dumicola]
MLKHLNRSDSEDKSVTLSAIKEEAPDNEISMVGHYMSLISSQPDSSEEETTAEVSFLPPALPMLNSAEGDTIEKARPVERPCPFPSLLVSKPSQLGISGETDMIDKGKLSERPYPYPILAVSKSSQLGTSGEPSSAGRSFLDTGSESDANDNDDIESAAKRARYENISWFKKDLPPKIHDFSPTDSGDDDIALENSSTFEYFRIFWSEPFLSFIVNETNKYYKYMSENSNQGIHARLIKWKNTTLKEMYSFLALTMLMSRMKNMSFVEFWSKDSLLSTSVFGEVMAKDRYLLLLRMLHFCDNSQPRSEDRFFKIRYIVQRLQEDFRSAFHPFQKFYCEGNTLIYKGRLLLKQYLPSKKSNFGIKMFILCDWDSGYVLDFVVCSESSTVALWEHSNHANDSDTVISLLRPYLEKGHNIFIDNWDSSPDLFLCLYHKTANDHSIEMSRTDIPVMAEKLKKKEIQFTSSNLLLSLKWHERSALWMLSTHQSGEIINQALESDIKPNFIVDYSNSVYAIEKLGMTLSSTEYVRKSIKWYKILFLHLLDLSILNARALHKVLTGKNFTIAKFELTLIREMLDKYKEQNKSVEEKTSLLPRLVERHFLSLYVSERSKKKNPVTRCIVCSKHNNRRETRYWCFKCRVGLCVVPCFEMYHTREDY